MRKVSFKLHCVLSQLFFFIRWEKIPKETETKALTLAFQCFPVFQLLISLSLSPYPQGSLCVKKELPCSEVANGRRRDGRKGFAGLFL